MYVSMYVCIHVCMYANIYECIWITVLHILMSRAAGSAVREHEISYQKPLNTLVQEWLVLVMVFANSGHKAPIRVRSEAQS